MRTAFILVAAFCLPSAACAPSLPHPVFSPQSTADLVRVDEPPPAARVELLPARPSPGAVWVDGEWIWRRGRWAWLVGGWVIAPPEETFSPWVFVRGRDGSLFYAPGVWRDTTGAPVSPPSALGIATVESGAVVDPAGATETTGATLRERPR